MRQLYFKQRFFSWFDSYDIYDEHGQTLYAVKGEFSWGHQLRIYDAQGLEAGLVKERVLSFLPRFEMYDANGYLGQIKKEFTFFRPRYQLDYQGWTVQGDLFGWDYTVMGDGGVKAQVTKELLRLTDTYQITVYQDEDALLVLMIILAIDAANCSRNNS